MSSVQCDLAVLHYGSNIERPVVTGFTGSTASLRAVSLAIDLAHEDHGQLIIILPATDDLKYEQLNKAIEENFNMQQLRISLVRLPNNSTDQILHVIQQFHGRILLLESSSAFLTDEQKQALIAQADIPVIFLH
jgi:nucleotide-binding universal stress UspA family protein